MIKGKFSRGTLIYLAYGTLLLLAVAWTDARGWVYSSLFTSEGKMGARTGGVRHK